MKPIPTILTMTLALSLATMASGGSCPLEDAFPGQDVIPMGGRHGVDLADLDGDGDMDFAAVSKDEALVRIGLNDGAGAFTVTAVPTIAARRVTIGDVDEDGHGDLLLAGATGGVAVHRGHGDGTFDPLEFYAFGSAARDVALTDVDDDGVPDVVANDSNGNAVGVLLGVGDGTFLPAVSWAVGGFPIRLAVTDLDLDGWLDIVSANYDGDDISILLNRGDGTFEGAVSIPIGDGPSDPLAGDFNADGIPDLAVSAHLESTLTILIGNGDGSFATGAVHDIAGGADTVRAWDANGDASPDLVCQGFDDGVATVLLGQPDGTFTPGAVHLTGWWSSRDLVTGDVDGDGIEDTVSANSFGLAIATGRGDGTMRGPSAIALTTSETCNPVCGRTFDVESADMNGDGIRDLVVTPEGLFLIPGVHVILGTGDGTFAPATFQSTGPASRPFMCAVGDLDHDGAPDVVVANFSQDEVLVLMGNGDGTLQVPVPYATGALPFEVRLADVNEDGHLDVMVAGDGFTDVDILFGQGDGTLLAGGTVTVGYLAVVVDDLDDDGHLDLTAVDGTSVARVLGNGDGTFGARETYEMQEWIVGMDAADFDGDGLLDVAVTTNLFGAGPDVRIRLGTGDGHFGPLTIIPLGGSSLGLGGLAAGDLDADGNVDIVVTYDGPGDVFILRGLGDGTFETPRIITSARAWHPLIDDLDGNGTADLAFASRNGGAIALHFNQCRAACPADVDGDGSVNVVDLVAILTSWGPCPACPADVTGDGVVDVSDLVVVLLAWGPCA